MAGSATYPTTLANLAAGNQPLSLLDSNFSPLYTAVNSLNTFNNYYVDVGSANAYALTVAAPQTVSLAVGLPFCFKAANANTGASTLAVNGGGPLAVVRRDGSALQAADIPANSLTWVVHDGSRYQLMSPSVNVNGAVISSVRQTALTGGVSSAGQPNFLAAGAGLTVNLTASASVAVTLAFAQGFGQGGQLDYIGQFTATQTSYWTLPANQLSFLAVDRNPTTFALSATQSLVPPQYGYKYDQTKQALLHFDGTNGATTTTDDYGNTWTLSSSAQLDTGTKKFGTAALKLQSAGARMRSTNFTSLWRSFEGNGSWTVEYFINFNALPGVGTTMSAGLIAVNGSNFGVILGLNNNAGTRSLNLWASSNGSSFDLANGTVGSNTTWATATWYHLVLTFDAVNSKLLVYKDGVVDINVAASSLICPIVNVDFGPATAGLVNDLNGWIDELRYSLCCRYPNGTSFTPTTAAFGLDGDYFNLQSMSLLQPTTASAAAASDPTFTSTQRVYVGEAVTGAAAVSSATTYALKGQYQSADTTVPAVGTRTGFAANLGMMPLLEPVAWLRNYTTDNGYSYGHVVRAKTNTSIVGNVVADDRNTLGFTTGSATAISGQNRTTGADVAFTSASWKLFVTAQRGW